MADATAASADELDDADESGQHWDGGHEGDAITDTQAFDIVGAPTPHTPESLSLPPPDKPMIFISETTSGDHPVCRETGPS